MSAIYVALIALAGVVITAAMGLASSLLLNRQNRQRLDIITAISAGTAKVAEETAKVAEETAKVAEETRTKVDAVHELADGSLTAAYRAELAAVEAQVLAMEKPSPETQATIRATRARIVVMRRALTDREASNVAAHQLIANGVNRIDPQEPGPA